MTQDATSSPDPEHITDFIACLAPKDREDLLRLATGRNVTRHELIFQVGSAGNYVYFLESGRVKIYHLSLTGKEILLWFCFPGEIFGLTEVCHGGGRQVYAEAREPSELLCVRQEDFKTFLETHPPAALLVNDVLARRLRSLGHIIQSLVANDVNERVVQLILRLAASHGHRAANGSVCLDMRLTHQEMANMIGTTRQSVTSVLNLLRRQGVLEFDTHHRILVHNDLLMNQMTATDLPVTPRYN
ncbi:MAG: Crp/Fnr family transcriptional regulator [Gammaproteobacteria bacterium]|nr:Crp/Fnr family transcriptional regulator [Gammaproteobacteria bacterium]